MNPISEITINFSLDFMSHLISLSNKTWYTSLQNKNILIFDSSKSSKHPLPGVCMFENIAIISYRYKPIHVVNQNGLMYHNVFILRVIRMFDCQMGSEALECIFIWQLCTKRLIFIDVKSFLWHWII